MTGTVRTALKRLRFPSAHVELMLPTLMLSHLLIASNALLASTVMALQTLVVWLLANSNVTRATTAHLAHTTQTSTHAYLVTTTTFWALPPSMIVSTVASTGTAPNTAKSRPHTARPAPITQNQPLQRYARPAQLAMHVTSRMMEPSPTLCPAR